MQTIIIGHKNPDMDSICSALGYARLKQLLGVPDVVAARAGSTNARIDFVLEKFGVEATGLFERPDAARQRCHGARHSVRAG